MSSPSQSGNPKPDTRGPDADFVAIEEGSPLEQIQSELEDATSTTSNYEIVSIPADFTLEGLVAKWRKKQIEIPGFQRKFVWTQKQASRLVESFLLGLPVPPLFLYADPDTGAQQVIDGQQRLMSVVQFLDGQFKNATMPEAKLFRLIGLDDASRYSGLTYKELEDRFPPMFAKLNDAVLRAFVIKQLDPDDSTSIYHIFERLNTGGTTLLGQEIRNCVYHGRLNELIGQLNTETDWREIIGKKEPDSRMRDIEMILRFVALYFFASEYRKPMKDFLSRSMRRKRNLPIEEANHLATIFRETCRVVCSTLGSVPFHGDRGMNPAVFDSVFTTIAKHLDAVPKDLPARFKKLVSGEEFRAKASYRTTDPEAVERRLRLAKDTLVGGA